MMNTKTTRQKLYVVLSIIILFSSVIAAGVAGGVTSWHSKGTAIVEGDLQVTGTLSGSNLTTGNTYTYDNMTGTLSLPFTNVTSVPAIGAYSYIISANDPVPGNYSARTPNGTISWTSTNASYVYNNAQLAAYNAGGGLISPIGDFTFSSPLLQYANVSVQGIVGKTVFRTTGSYNALISNATAATNNYKISGIEIVGSADVAYGIYITEAGGAGSPPSYFSELSIHHFNTTGMRLAQEGIGTEFYIDNCNFCYNTNTGLFVEAGDGWISNCYDTGNFYGLKITGSYNHIIRWHSYSPVTWGVCFAVWGEYNSFIDCEAETGAATPNLTGFDVNANGNSIIGGVTFGLKTGISVYGATFNLTISDFQFRDYTLYGIDVPANLTGLSIDHCTFGNAGTGTADIHVTTAMTLTNLRIAGTDARFGLLNEGTITNKQIYGNFTSWG